MSEPQAESILKEFTLQSDLCSEESLFHIDSEANWFYQGSPLPKKFARLFYSILNVESGEHYLITPVEKVKVDVIHEPIKIVDYELLADGCVQLTTNLETKYVVDSFNVFYVTDSKITCTIDRGLMASLNRACYYRYIEEYILA